ncbi:glycosyltransferase [Estrella lausannensis]|uniref:Glycosyltransferase n=1 Tax=Estrella lausannensis TaxID=483423 RepID=A0A0H5DMP2_9BACT|nr:glycosyltransferase [Estrella lausannensis]CRX37401.1 Glycosyltransferase [Estrella lausannensis]
MILLSIVVIGNQAEESLRDCLSSCLSMHMSEGVLEVIYIDAKASSQNIAIARELGVRTLILKDTNASQAHCKNLALKAASGEFVFFISPKSIIHPDFGMRAIEEFKEMSVGIVIGSVRELNPARSLYCSIVDLQLRRLEGLLPYVSGDMVLRKSSLDDVGGFDERLNGSETEDISYRLHKKGWLLRSLDVPMSLINSRIDTVCQCVQEAYAKGYTYAPLFGKYQAEPSPCPKDLLLSPLRFAWIFVLSVICPFVLSFIFPAHAGAFFVVFILLFSLGFLFLAVRFYLFTSLVEESRILRFWYTLHHFVVSLPITLGWLAYSLDQLIGRKRS